MLQPTCHKDKKIKEVGQNVHIMKNKRKNMYWYIKLHTVYSTSGSCSTCCPVALVSPWTEKLLLIKQKAILLVQYYNILKQNTNICYTVPAPASSSCSSSKSPLRTSSSSRLRRFSSFYSTENKLDKFNPNPLDLNKNVGFHKGVFCLDSIFLVRWQYHVFFNLYIKLTLSLLDRPKQGPLLFYSV